MQQRVSLSFFNACEHCVQNNWLTVDFQCTCALSVKGRCLDRFTGELPERKSFECCAFVVCHDRDLHCIHACARAAACARATCSYSMLLCPVKSFQPQQSTTAKYARGGSIAVRTKGNTRSLLLPLQDTFPCKCLACILVSKWSQLRSDVS